MTLTFQQLLDVELLRSEKRRTIIIITIFLFALCYRVFEMHFFSNDEESLRIQSFATVWLFPLAVIMFEFFYLLHINRRIKMKKGKMPIYRQYINTVIEISLPGLVMLAVARQYPGYDVLKSPAAFIYFLFIILSTLRLNFSLSLFSGLLAAASYYVISFFVYNHFGSMDAARAFIFLLSGIAAGLVAKQIRSGINNSVLEAEKSQRVVNLFGQQISKEVADKMLEQDGKIESKRMNVAVMFIDIRDFTKFAAGKNPEEIVQYQNAFFTLVVDAVSKHGGIVNQFLGDGCMTTFGAPLVSENPSQQAVNAALELIQQLEIARQHNKIIPTRIGVGIHTGEAITGNIGNADRQQYSITGSVVIMASRIEQLNKQFHSQVLVSEEVIRCIENTKTVEKYNGIELKGFDQPISIYKVA
ncbi:MAG: adenylate/guanylate cyclase domain-containing protein [Ferruginibacter sp.]